ncbi:glutamine-fructose-6-phosphate transaminase [Cavenderia fasciculata]|uniref:Glutamine-fructose-6-phosphate transaminase n=1 Tax=Cavenderia fasciculata TaxID=261658 RepID=F4PNF7_CACFS|nr:glutamine-fructose-6-phosphate transaminase [Cavenderia fasciculata]EGG23010.1 glutamine-fructose-6-phosphate transaminase [Cavenderia fasciculata]|eukprot:XP_004360861.1 glutamine-fructose-6-phosphate transaminase [Cavenderia fasciculata]
MSEFQNLLSKQPVRLANRNEHPYHMYDMIVSTPDSIDRFWKEERDTLAKVAKTIATTATRVIFVGIGTSYHCALNAKYFFEQVAQLDRSKVSIDAIDSFDFTQRTPYLDATTAVIIFSHRGIKKFSFDSYMKSKQAGSLTVLFTSIESPVVDGLTVVRTSHGEQSSAFTVSHTTSSFGALCLANEVAKVLGNNVSALESELAAFSNTVKSILSNQDSHKLWASRFKNVPWLPFTGYSGNVSNAHEVALKIKEACWKLAEGSQVEQFIHGPFVACGNNTVLTTLISTDDKLDVGRQRSICLLRAVKLVGGQAAAIIQDSENQESIKEVETAVGQDGVVIKVPKSSEPINVLTSLLSLQLITYHISLEVGTNPDVFRKDQPEHSSAFLNSGIVL